MLIQIILLISFLSLWEISARKDWIDPFIFSQPTKMLFVCKEMLWDGSLWTHIRTTLLETIAGFLLATFSGTFAAVLLWWNRFLSDVTEPYLVILNSRQPASEAARMVQKEIMERYGVEPVVADCQALTTQDIHTLLAKLLYAFPLRCLRVYMPRWMDALEPEHPVKAALYEALMQRTAQIQALGQAEATLSDLKQLQQVLDFRIRGIDLATGTVDCALTFPEQLFYEILSAKAGVTIESEAQLLELLTALAQIKREYDKVSDALNAVRATGYGIVMPTAEEMTLNPPQLLQKNGAFGVKLKAAAPSVHMIRVDIDTEISPMVGGEQQSQELVSYLSAQTPEMLWQSNIFGRSVYELVREGLSAKVVRLPEDVRDKFRGSLNRIVNEGATGLICLIL